MCLRRGKEFWRIQEDLEGKRLGIEIEAKYKNSKMLRQGTPFLFIT